MDIAHLDNDSSVYDYAVVKGIDCDGTARVTLFALTYDDEGRYIVTEYLDGEEQDQESFEIEVDAQRTYAAWVKRAERHYAKEQRAYDRGRVQATVVALRGLLDDQGDDLDPDASQAILGLIKAVQDGNARKAAVVLAGI